MSDAPRPAAPRRDALLLAAVAGCLYWLLRQSTFYGTDGRHVLKMIGSGLELHDKHFLYVPLLRGCQAALGPLGWSPYEAAMLVSVLGAAFAVFGTHRVAARLLPSRGDAAMAAALVGTSPAVVFYATVVELHTPFFAAAALALACAADVVARPTLARALLAGAATGLATGLHQTGHFLWFVVLALFAWRPASWGALARQTACAGLGHGAAFAALLGGLALAGYTVGLGSSAATLGGNRYLRASALPGTIWRDWLLPFMPLALAALASLPRAARAGWLFAVALVSYLALTFVLVAPGTEHGAYLLPLAVPAALLTVMHWPRLLQASVLVVGTFVSFGMVSAHDQPGAGREFVAGVRAAAGDLRPILICGAHREFDALPIHGPDLEWHDLIDEAAMPPAAVLPMVAQLEVWLRGCAARGEVVLITQAALDYLSKPIGDQQETGPLLRAAIERALQLEPVRVRRFEGYRLRARG